MNNHTGFPANPLEETKDETSDLNPSQNYQSTYVNIENAGQVNFGTTVISQINNDSIDYSALTSKLKITYKDAKLPMVSWMEEEAPLPLSNYYIRLQIASTKTNITVENLLDGDQTTIGNPIRILIEGQPGFGKTTLATKIMYDWAEGAQYLHKFTLAFLLPLKVITCIESGDIITAIATYYEIENVQSFRTFLINNSKEILFVLDGYDEIGGQDKLKIRRLLYKDICKEATVIVTCRTGFVDDTSDLTYHHLRCAEWFDKRVKILGINTEEAERFLQTFFDQNEWVKISKQFTRLTESMKDLFRSPLFSLIFARIIIESENLSQIDSMTEMFKLLINYIVKRSLARNEELSSHQYFDMFNPSDLSGQTIYKDIVDFGCYCSQYLLDKRYVFTENEMIKQMYKFGLLSYSRDRRTFQLIERYECFHLTIMEFVAAVYICDRINQNVPYTAELVNSIAQKLGTPSLVIPFTVGLLGKEVSKFFEIMQPYAYMYTPRRSRYLLFAMMAEVKSINSNKFDSFLPFRIDSPALCQFTKTVIRQSLQTERSVRLSLLNSTFANLPQDVAFPILLLDLRFNCFDQLERVLTNLQGDVTSDVTEVIKRLKSSVTYLKSQLPLINSSICPILRENILVCLAQKKTLLNKLATDSAEFPSLLQLIEETSQQISPTNKQTYSCDTLLIDARINQFKTALPVNLIWSTCSLVNAQKIGLALDDNKVLEHDFAKQGLLNYLSYTNTFESKFKVEVLDDVIRTNTLDVLCINCIPFDDLQTLMPRIRVQNLLLKTKGRGNWEEEKLNLFTNDQTNWLHISLRGFGLKFPERRSKKAVHFLSIDTSDVETAKTVSLLDITLLECTPHLLNNMFRNGSYFWPGYKSVTELSIIMEDDVKPEFWARLKRFKKLKILKVLNEFGDDFSSKKLFQLINSMSINHFGYSSKSNWENFIDLISLFHKSLKKPKVISIHIMSSQNRDQLELVVEILMSLLKARKLLKVYIVCHDDIWFYVQNYVMHVEGVIIERNFLGFDQENSEMLNIMFRHPFKNEFTGVHLPQFSITLRDNCNCV